MKLKDYFYEGKNVDSLLVYKYDLITFLALLVPAPVPPSPSHTAPSNNTIEVKLPVP
jgi:hypothetical protein